MVRWLGQVSKVGTKAGKYGVKYGDEEVDAGQAAARYVDESGQALRGANHPSTRAALNRGNKVHSDFAKTVDAKPGWTPNPRIEGPDGSIHIPDATDSAGRAVELKPNTPSGRQRGAAQIERYKDVTGKNGRVIYYE
jgi:hypothetical protein